MSSRDRHLHLHPTLLSCRYKVARRCSGNLMTPFMATQVVQGLILCHVSFFSSLTYVVPCVSGKRNEGGGGVGSACLRVHVTFPPPLTHASKPPRVPSRPRSLHLSYVTSLLGAPSFLVAFSPSPLGCLFLSQWNYASTGFFLFYPVHRLRITPHMLSNHHVIGVVTLQELQKFRHAHSVAPIDWPLREVWWQAANGGA